MAGFEFRLQSVLRLREHQREQRQMELANAYKRLREIQTSQSSVHREIQELVLHMRSHNNKENVDVDRLLDGHRYQLALKARLAEIAQAMGEASDEVERCRRNLIEADRQVKVLEKLHEKQLDEHRQRLAREETKQLDEAALLGKTRQS